LLLCTLSLLSFQYTPTPHTLPSSPTRRSSDLQFCDWAKQVAQTVNQWGIHDFVVGNEVNTRLYWSPQKSSSGKDVAAPAYLALRSEEHTSELQSRGHLVCRLLLEKKKSDRKLA